MGRFNFAEISQVIIKSEVSIVTADEVMFVSKRLVLANNASCTAKANFVFASAASLALFIARNWIWTAVTLLLDT